MSTIIRAAIPSDELTNPTEIKALVIMERLGGSLSLLSVLCIFLTYLIVPRVRNVQNTFIVFASISNVGACIASLIALDGIKAGQNSPLCQAQAFMFEMFMQSDPWWSLAMAVNVFLVFYFRTSPDSFRRWWWVYCLICYGGPFVFAITLLFVKKSGQPPVYGEATIWCWVDDSWGYIRIYTYYMLIWICIAGSLIFYFLVGYHVFRTRNQFRSFSNSRGYGEGSQINRSRIHPEAPMDEYYGTVTTEVQVDVHSRATKEEKRQSQQRNHPNAHVAFDGGPDQANDGQYYSTVTSPPKDTAKEMKKAPDSQWMQVKRSVLTFTGKFVVEDPIKRAYLRTSLLFTLSVLVTWIPSSLNRILGWITPSLPFGYYIAAATVLPLQGLWNGVIFFVTSWDSLKIWWNDVRGDRRASEAPPMSPDAQARLERKVTRRDVSSESDMDFDVPTRQGSTVELRRMTNQPRKVSNDTTSV